MKKHILFLVSLGILLNACASKSIIAEKPKSLSEVSQALELSKEALQKKEALDAQAKIDAENQAKANKISDASIQSTAVNNTIKDNRPKEKIIYFDTNSYTIKNEFKDVLKKHYQYINETKNPIVLQGHTDQRGTSEYNLALGQKRAEASKNGLAILGTDVKLIETVSFGEEKPEDSNENEEAYSKNRRSLVIYK